MSILRTAARVGVASSVHGRVQRRQQQRWAAQDQHAAMIASQAPPPPVAAAPAPPAPPATSTEVDMNESLAQLKQLGELRDAGILTDAEFEAKKAKILGS